MAERPEVAIQAILAGIQNMQQLNIQLADRLAGGGPLGQGPGVEQDHLGRTRSEAWKDYLCFTRDRPTFERGREQPDLSPARWEWKTRPPEGGVWTAAAAQRSPAGIMEGWTREGV